MYRYGDGSPFPFEENFLEIIAAAVDASVAMFAAAGDLEGLRQQARDAKREADEEGRRLAGLEKSVEQALFPARPSNARDASISQQTAQKLLSSTKQSINAARVQLEKRAAAAAAVPRPERAASAAHDAARVFFDRNQLPGTTWEWRWASSGGARGDATAYSGRFTAIFDLVLDPGWRGPVRIGTLVPSLSVLIPKKRAFGKPSPSRVHLDKAWLIGADSDGEELVLQIREHGNKPSSGWRIKVDGGRATCVVVDSQSRAIGGEIELGAEDAAALGTLAEAIEDELTDMRERRRAREVCLGDAPLSTLPDATVPARALLEVLAPTILTMRKKSRMPGELILKRDIADGKREELFLPRAGVTAKYARLPSEYRRFFDDAGLGRDETSEVSDSQIDTAPPTLPTLTMGQAAGKPGLRPLPTLPRRVA
jgi:hypothetical protein